MKIKPRHRREKVTTVDTMAEENVDFSVVKKNVPGKFGKLSNKIVDTMATDNKRS